MKIKSVKITELPKKWEVKEVSKEDLDINLIKKKIKKYGLNIDTEDYIKRGNIYLYSYYCFYHQKCWYDSKFKIYDQTDIIKKMPTKYLNLEDYWIKNPLVWDFLKNHNNI
jgi:hypothetical protein